MSEFLTPQGVNEWVAVMDICPENAAHVATLREMAAICEAFALTNPFTDDDDGRTYCMVCGSVPTFGAVRHAPDCLYIRARKLRGKEGGE